ncbi:hypothetical protein [Bradyrhizobium sp. AS23.2]|uniref:hypothetical protein n=1 Tax=Bradyrhizobium sp. AS23.2 TaxID=1680155 RepID=UPI001FD8E26D|nr:hypothetical protein [Bradyrhizobium sp. AS23.2]
MKAGKWFHPCFVALKEVLVPAGTSGGFDFDAALRWARFDPRKTLARRQDSDLPFVRDDRIGGQSLLLDTCVYIDQMQGRTPDNLEVLIANRQTNHSSVAIQELMDTIGVLDPEDGRSRTAIDAIRTLILSVPARTERSFLMPMCLGARRCYRV